MIPYARLTRSFLLALLSVSFVTLTPQSFAIPLTMHSANHESVPASPTPTTATYLPLVVRPVSWVEVFADDFEGEFPGAWEIRDLEQRDTHTFVWGQRDCPISIGTFSAWGVGGGSDGQMLPCNSHYPRHVRSAMVRGPFDLSDAKNVELSFDIWRNTSHPHDALLVGVSVDNSRFVSTRFWGPVGEWRSVRQNIRRVRVIGDIAGQPEVYLFVMFMSKSEGPPRAYGAMIDNIALRAFVPQAGHTDAEAPPRPEPVDPAHMPYSSPAIVRLDP